MTDETTAPPAPEPAPSPAPEPAAASLRHALADDFHALLARVESMEHEAKTELASGLDAIVAKLKAAL
jgi:hypothetical protein